MTVIQQVRSPLIPAGVEVVTVVINHPPGVPGYPPHRLPGGPGFGYMISGEMLFEIEGEAPRVLRAGDAFWGPGGDVIHYQDANIRPDIPCRFVLTLLCEPGKPMLERVTEEELEARKNLRVRTNDSHAATADESEKRANQWRAATRELVLTAATATAAVDPPQPHGCISITMTGTALSNDLLLADTGSIALASLGGTEDAVHHSMSVVPMRLDMLSEVPVINVVGSEISAPTHLRLLVELSVRNPHTDTISVMMCEFDSVYLDPRTPTDRLDFRPQRARPPR